MRRGRSFAVRFLLLLAVLAVVLAASCTLWLPLIGRALIHDEGPAQADIAVTLGGDYWGHRVELAGMLVRRGYVPSVLVSGPTGFYGLHECDLAIPYAASKGFPAEWFQPLPHDALSTRDEVTVILAELRRRGIHRALIVTTDFHTARARRLFLAAAKKMPGAPELRMVASPDQFFHADSWWHGRESQKTTFFEWSKTVATMFGY